MALLLWLGRRHKARLISGDLFLIYLLVYPLGRFLLEFLRLDPAMVAGVNANQTLMAIVALAAGALLVWRHRGDRPDAKEPRRRRRKKTTSRSSSQ
jgi:phosphatidylglycerol:prolipoprotein diacylglycerol transferase